MKIFIENNKENLTPENLLVNSSVIKLEGEIKKIIKEIKNVKVENKKNFLLSSDIYKHTLTNQSVFLKNEGFKKDSLPNELNNFYEALVHEKNEERFN